MNSEQIHPRFLARIRKVQQCGLAELRASLAAERDGAIDSLKKALRTAESSDKQSADPTETLVRSLKKALVKLEQLNPDAPFDADELLDTQKRVYSHLCEATRLLCESQHPAGLGATAACVASAQVVGQLARQDSLGKEDALRKIYDDLELVSAVICSALGIGGPADQQELIKSRNSVQPEIS